MKNVDFILFCLWKKLLSAIFQFFLIINEIEYKNPSKQDEIKKNNIEKSFSFHSKLIFWIRIEWK